MTKSTVYCFLLAVFLSFAFEDRARAWKNRPRGYSPAGEAATRADDQDLERLRRAPRKPIVRRGIPADVQRPIHIMLLFVDHWEPCDYVYGLGWGGPYYESESARLADFWLVDYHKMAIKHRDADGRMPQHTWFTYEPALEALKRISKSAFLGLGEIEIHLHHGTTNDTNRDNTAEFKGLIKQWISYMNEVGACRTAEPQPRNLFGFIHGNWALDNSRTYGGSREYCGVNRELDVLTSLGCYADFTFPSGYPTQPLWNDKVFVSRDSDAPRSYGDPSLVREPNPGQPIKPGEFLIFEGPGPTCLEPNVDEYQPLLAYRMEWWLEYNVHLPCRPNWVFVKMATHSAQNLARGYRGYDAFIGETADQFYTDLETEYNDGVKFNIHYVTAREAFNIARAAIDGMPGDPGQYRDYIIPRPANRHFYVNQTYQLLRFNPKGPSAALEIKVPYYKIKNLEIWAHDFTPTAAVYEGHLPRGPFFPSDATLTSSSQARMVLTDPTPSRFYHFYANQQNAACAWGRYR